MTEKVYLLYDWDYDSTTYIGVMRNQEDAQALAYKAHLVIEEVPVLERIPDVALLYEGDWQVSPSSFSLGHSSEKYILDTDEQYAKLEPLMPETYAVEEYAIYIAVSGTDKAMVEAKGQELRMKAVKHFMEKNNE